MAVIRPIFKQDIGQTISQWPLFTQKVKGKIGVIFLGFYGWLLGEKVLVSMARLGEEEF